MALAPPPSDPPPSSHQAGFWDVAVGGGGAVLWVVGAAGIRDLRALCSRSTLAETWPPAPASAAARFVASGRAAQGGCALRLGAPPCRGALGLLRLHGRPAARRTRGVFAKPRTPRFSVLPNVWGQSRRRHYAHINLHFRKWSPRHPNPGQGFGHWAPGGRPLETARLGPSPAPHVPGTVTGPQGPE